MNSKKLREALENSNGLLEELTLFGEQFESAQEQIKENNAALAAPAEPISNEAKLRETLMCIDNIISHIEVGNVRDILHAYKNIHDRIKIALSAAPRNCERFKTKEEAALAYAEERNAFIPQSILWEMGELLDWLFAKAKGAFNEQ